MTTLELINNNFYGKLKERMLFLHKCGVEGSSPEIDERYRDSPLAEESVLSFVKFIGSGIKLKRCCPLMIPGGFIVLNIEKHKHGTSKSPKGSEFMHAPVQKAIFIDFIEPNDNALHFYIPKNSNYNKEEIQKSNIANAHISVDKLVDELKHNKIYSWILKNKQIGKR